MKKKVIMVGISGDEPTLLTGEGHMLSSRMIQQENPFSFPLNAQKTRQDIQPLGTGSWGLFSPSLFAYFSCSLLSISSFWCSFHHTPPSILP